MNDPGLWLALILIGGPIALRFSAGRLVRPKLLTLPGGVPPPDLWFPTALEKSCGRFSSVRWRYHLLEIRDERDNPVSYRGELIGDDGEILISATLPFHNSPEAFAHGRSSGGVVAFENFPFRGGFYRLILGKYPVNPAFTARSRLIGQIKKQARKAVKSNQ